MTARGDTGGRVHGRSSRSASLLLGLLLLGGPAGAPAQETGLYGQDTAAPHTAGRSARAGVDRGVNAIEFLGSPLEVATREIGGSSGVIPISQSSVEDVVVDAVDSTWNGKVLPHAGAMFGRAPAEEDEPEEAYIDVIERPESWFASLPTMDLPIDGEVVSVPIPEVARGERVHIYRVGEFGAFGVEARADDGTTWVLHNDDRWLIGYGWYWDER